ncbi:MAG TPA: polysaccharide biosynthesis/export family protein [Candidatus Eremiobacteraceae bacterium]|nr:polysaccharide biosynthesis/export family protein [Candidatus Eremiobacteraceae bacterium]
MMQLRRVQWVLIVLAMGVVTALAQQSAPESPAPSPTAEATAAPASADATPAPDKSSTSRPVLGERHPRYTLQAGDSFDLSFDLSPEFNQSLTVQPDGYVSLRGVGDVHVAGQTVPQLTETLKKSYGKILNDPIISVFLKDFEKPYFTVDGQVGRPGKYDLRGDTTVTQALAVAGGVSASAKHSQVLLFRHVSDQWVEARILNYKKMMKDGNLSEDVYLHPGDMLYVPKNTYSKIQQFMPSANLGTYLRP